MNNFTLLSADYVSFWPQAADDDLISQIQIMQCYDDEYDEGSHIRIVYIWWRESFDDDDSNCAIDDEGEN